MFRYFYFLINRFLHISMIFKENVLLAFDICDLDAYHVLKAHRQCVWTSNLPSPRTPGSFTGQRRERGSLSRSRAAVSPPLPEQGLEAWDLLDGVSFSLAEPFMGVEGLADGARFP